jgi:hypothetical protein
MEKVSPATLHGAGLTFLYNGAMLIEIMNMKTKLFVVSLIVLLGIFSGGNMASAQVFFGTPVVVTNLATNINNNNATLNGYVSSNNNLNVIAWFEWGINSYYGYRTIPVNYGANIGTSYNYYLNGLAQNTVYYFRAVAQSSNGQVTYGNQVSFRTASDYVCTSYNCNINQPIVTTYSVTGINDTSVILNGYVNPNNSSATRWFEWGTNSSYFYNSTNKVGSINYPANFSEALYNLSPNTTYYYRVAAQNSTGVTVYGNVSIFITSNNVISGTYTQNTYIPPATTTVTTTNTTHTSTNNTNTAPAKKAATAGKNTDSKSADATIQQGALAFLFGNNFLPSTLISWLFLVLLVTLIVLAVRKAYNGKLVPHANK